ncbi:MAG: ABC transporter substrate-binding protein [Verrucomicrobiales bacterium]|jgi:NitT/TauT family transport system substrate-binding protein|nr:ABC transporter substrate-binding protein [Verrucomicrobiales bacterium]
MRKLFSILAAIAAVTTLASCSKKEHAERAAEPRVSLKVGHLPVTGHAKFYIAKEQGFFAQEGLDVELIEFTNSADGLNAVRSGQLDLGSFGTTAPLVHISKGADIRIIGGVMGNDADVLVKKEHRDQYKTVADLRGKKIATIRLASGDAVLRSALKKAGLDWRTDVELHELKSPPAVAEAVRTGQVDAGVTWGPHDQLADSQGLAVVFRSLDLFPGGHPCCRLVVTGEQVEKQGQTWTKFIRAFLRAEQFAKEPANHDRVVEIITKYVKLEPAVLEKAYFNDNLDQSSDPNIKGLREFWQTMKDNGFIEVAADVEKKFDQGFFFDTAHYEEALRSLIKAHPHDSFYQEKLATFSERDK